MTCPDNNTIAELVCRQLGPHEMAEVEAHIADCRSCRKLVGTLAASSLPRLGASALGTEPAARARPTVLLRPGASVSRYQILGLLGAGAMGVVYSAHDPELDRNVALKLLHSELATDPRAARTHLLAEAQAMAKLRHQNVVAVHDAGTHGELVFVAMELIDGETLRHWLGTHRSWREIVRVVAAAGRGLAAAHALDIVHRDFKPENVLLGADGQVCVSDFGLARPVGAGGEIAGTPRYMAPEQRAGGSPDPRGDQYSFCVVFDEALAGSNPPAWLRSLVKRGLAVDPAARYPSMNALLQQLRDRAARRQRGLVALGAGGLVAASVIAARFAFGGGAPSCRVDQLDGIWDADQRRAVESTFLASRAGYVTVAVAQTTRALDSYATDWVQMRTEACEAARDGDRSDRLVDLRIECLERRRADLGALVRAFATADREVVAKAVVAAHSLEPLAECANTRALLARRAVNPAARPRLDDWNRQLATARSQLAIGRYRDARATAARVALDGHALDARETEAEALLLEGMALDKLGDPAGAETALRDAALAAESNGSDDDAARARIARIKAAADLGRFDDAHEYVRAATAAVERVGTTPLLQEMLATHEGILFAREGKFEDARARFQIALGVAIQQFSASDPRLARDYNNLGNSQQSLGKYRDAQASFEKALEIRRRQLGDEHPDVGTSRISLGQALSYQGKPEQALAQFRPALAILEASQGPDHPRVGQALMQIAGELSTLGRSDEALAMYRRALAIVEPIKSERATVALIHNNRGDLLDELGRYADAIAEYQVALQIRETLTGAGKLSATQSLTNMGTTLVKLGRHAEALAAFERALAIKTKALPADHVSLAPSLIGIGQVHVETHHPERAIAPLERAEKLLAAGDADPTDLATCRFFLARALWDGNRDRPRALALARGARRVFVEAGAASAVNLTAVDEWIAKATK